MLQVQPACVVLNHCDQVGVDTTTPAIMHMQDVFDIQQLREGRVGPIFVVDTEQEGLSVVQQVLDWILLP